MKRRSRDLYQKATVRNSKEYGNIDISSYFVLENDLRFPVECFDFALNIFFRVRMVLEEFRFKSWSIVRRVMTCDGWNTIFLIIKCLWLKKKKKKENYLRNRGNYNNTS